LLDLQKACRGGDIRVPRSLVRQKREPFPVEKYPVAHVRTMGDLTLALSAVIAVYCGAQNTFQLEM
jgi:hypothetical protein